jgi:Nickel responsive protein SCO4226-like
MDVHESLPEGATLKDVAAAHEADLKIGKDYGVTYPRYWYSENAKVFCLVHAPDADAATVHLEAHGLLADRIYEVVEGS